MISLSHENNRGEAAHGRIIAPGCTLYFSYDTIVGANCKRDGVYGTWYVHNNWGPTTGKHMNRMFNREPGHEVSADELGQIIKAAMYEAVLEEANQRITGGT